MKQYRWIFIGITAGILLTAAFLVIGSNWNAKADPGRQSAQQAGDPTTAALLDDEGRVVWSIQGSGESDEQPPEGFSLEGVEPQALPTPIPGETLLYFATADSDATGTVVYLLNTDSSPHTVALKGYSYNGLLGYSLLINVPAGSFLRLVSDSVVASPPPSWATPAPIVTNFTDFTYFARLSLPKGVKAEGYVVFNGGTGTVDPRLDQGAIPLRFSTDPATVFLPSVQNAP